MAIIYSHYIFSQNEIILSKPREPQQRDERAAGCRPLPLGVETFWVRITPPRNPVTQHLSYTVSCIIPRVPLQHNFSPTTSLTLLTPYEWNSRSLGSGCCNTRRPRWQLWMMSTPNGVTTRTQSPQPSATTSLSKPSHFNHLMPHGWRPASKDSSVRGTEPSSLTLLCTRKSETQLSGRLRPAKRPSTQKKIHHLKKAKNRKWYSKIKALCGLDKHSFLSSLHLTLISVPRGRRD